MPKENKQIVKIAIIGGGVSSVTAALTFPLNFSVDIYEREDRLLKKLLKTGNGKANIFNINVDETSYNNPDFIKNHPNLVEFVKTFYRDLGVLTFTDEEGRGYPYSRSARSLANYLVNHLQSNVNALLNSDITRVETKGDKVIVNDKSYDYLLLATGSSAYDPKVNVDNDNTHLFESLNIKTTPFYPTSGPLMIKENLRVIENEKVKATLTIKNGARLITREAGEILFKRDSLSGIASFIASSQLTWDYRQYQNSDYTLSLNLIEGSEDEVISLLTKRQIDNNVFKGIVSEQLANYLASRMAKNININELMCLLTDLKFKLSQNFVLTHDKGQLMSGGVDLEQINAHNLALNEHNNIYILGEALDIDGVSGGYNLMFATYSGLLVSKNIIDKHCQQ